MDVCDLKLITLYSIVYESHNIESRDRVVEATDFVI